jgi:hypothetical protein
MEQIHEISNGCKSYPDLPRFVWLIYSSTRDFETGKHKKKAAALFIAAAFRFYKPAKGVEPLTYALRMRRSAI